MRVPLLFVSLSLAAFGQVDFAKQVQPILEKNCLACHAANRGAGGLKLNTRANAARAIVPGDPAKSPLLRTMEIAPGQPLAMPPGGPQVPAAGHFYMGTQCFHCQNAPCIDVCPVKATWMEPDGIVVVDYNWCIGCRYCMAACPYDARRFNWADPVVPAEEVNPNQHYLGNRLRKKGVVEKCTFCIQRSRDGKNPACVEACPTGARVFGNLLDPNSEIRWILANKKVFRLKEDLGTDPKFWYFMD